MSICQYYDSIILCMYSNTYIYQLPIRNYARLFPRDESILNLKTLVEVIVKITSFDSLAISLRFRIEINNYR